MFQKHPILLFLAIVILGGVTYTLYNTEQNKFQYAINDASMHANAFVSDFATIANDSSLTYSLTSGEIGPNSMNKAFKFPFHYFIYNADTLEFWNNNMILPESKMNNIRTEGSILQLKNGFYLAVRQEVDNRIHIGLELIKYNYSIENRYLQNEFKEIYHFDKGTTIAFPSFPAGEAVKDAKGETLFKVIQDYNPNSNTRILSLVISYITWFALILITCWLAFQSFKNYGAKKGFVLLILGTIFLKIGLQFIPFEFLKTDLFSPELYANAYLGKSLGHFFINAFLLAIITSAAFSIIREKQVKGKDVSFWALLVVALLGTAYFFAAIRSLIMDSTISFEINNFTILNKYTFVGLTVVVFLNVLFFLWENLLLKNILKSGKTFWLGALSLAVHSIVVYLILGSLVWALGFFAFLLVFYLIQGRWGMAQKRLTLFSSSIIILFFASFLTAGILETYNVQKRDNKHLVAAQQLSKQRDLIAEYKYNEIHNSLQEDPFLKQFLASPLVTKKEVKQRLNYLYFDGYLSKYNIEVMAFNKEGYLIKSAESDSIERIKKLLLLGDSTYSNSLYFFPQEDGNFFYFSYLKVEKNGDFLGNIVIQLSPKTYQKDNLYPELLVEEKNRPIIEGDNDYDYAIYVNDKLSSQAGEFPYPFDLDFVLQEGKESAKFESFGYRHLIYSDTPSRSVVVSEPLESFIMPVSIFSYLFCFFLIIGIAAIVVLSFLAKYVWKSKDWNVLNMSFRNRVNFAMILIIVSSFVIIGIITIRYFSNEYDNYHEQRLIRKQKSVLSALEYTIKENYTPSKGSITLRDMFSSGLSNDVAALSEIHSMDINIFDLSGNLVISSQPGIFTNGLISSKINPNAFFTMKQHEVERLVQDEQIGSLNYLAIYIPIRDKLGNAIAYLNLPYFAKEENMRTEISEFMVALVNVYVFLLLIAGVIAFLVSNSITSPLAEISKKLRQVNLSAKNEAITWESNDEIGALVQEYNKMIAQLEQSAKLLARSERESAWREMARQIAHEIKNPLTPMKLSIQHLQRTISQDPESAKALTERVSKTLIEQIENLSNIATAFSSFAKMPKANNEIIDLKQILEGVVDLFKDQQTISLHFKTSLKEAILFADKNQMVSVFNNLVKNAIQATEESVKPEVSVELLLEDDHFKVEIIDNGVGISEEMKDKVFVPNFTTKSSGTGLGLAISKQIIEQSASGAIWFDSTEERGTSFYVKLPIYKPIE